MRQYCFGNNEMISVAAIIEMYSKCILTDRLETCINLALILLELIVNII